MAWVCGGCGRELPQRGAFCPACDNPRDLRSETHLKAVGFWMVAASLGIVIAAVLMPLLNSLGTPRAIGYRAHDRTFGWIFLLIVAIAMFFLGRGLYRLSNAARMLTGTLSLFCSFVSIIAAIAVFGEARILSPDTLLLVALLASNGACWGAVGVLLIREPAARVCGERYLRLHGEARPLARFYSSPWFWALFVVHGSLIAALAWLLR